MKILRVLLCVVVATFFELFSDGVGVAGTLLGKRSSRKVCQMMLGGLLMMLKMANFSTGAKSREKVVCVGGGRLLALRCDLEAIRLRGRAYVVFVGCYCLRDDVGGRAQYRTLQRL